MALNRFTEGYILKVLPPVFWNTWAESKANRRFDHVAYGLKPAHRVNAQHPTVNDDLPNRIISGEIQIRPNVKRLTSTGVEFDDGTFEDNIDAVLYATGYVFGFPFIDEEIIRVKKNHVRLFKMMFPPELQPCTLAVIGFFQPLGALMPISELQCRWAAAVFKVNALVSPHPFRVRDMCSRSGTKEGSSGFNLDPPEISQTIHAERFSSTTHPFTDLASSVKRTFEIHGV